LFDIGIAQGELERGQGMTMNTDASGKEHAGWTGEHG